MTKKLSIRNQVSSKARKRLSIKMKVTLWYTIFMTLLTVILLGVLISLSSSQVLSAVQNRVKEAVLGSLKEIDWDREDQKLEIDGDLVYFGDGVYLALYDSKGYLIEGLVPKEFPGGMILDPSRSGQVYTVTGSTNARWYVFDHLAEIGGYGSLWIRGMTSQTEAESTFSMLVRLAVILLPLMVMVTAFGGYYITKRAFLPVRQIAETADEINRGSDLSKRILLGEGKDEIFQLGATFDRMLGRLERQFEKEKQFTSDVSHELRTPVSVILSQCEYGLRENGTEEEKTEALDVILNQSKKMTRLISQLLMLSRADSGREVLHPELVNLSELLEVVLLEQSEKAEEKGIRLKETIQKDLLIRADETMLMRFFINLLSNALTYGKEAGTVEVSLSRENGMIHGFVRDDGPGIPAESLDKIWDRFYQVSDARTSGEEGGAGLGLPMVKWIAEAHHGSIGVESTFGEGTTFFFTFPSGETLI